MITWKLNPYGLSSGSSGIHLSTITNQTCPQNNPGQRGIISTPIFVQRQLALLTNVS